MHTDLEVFTELNLNLIALYLKKPCIFVGGVPTIQRHKLLLSSTMKMEAECSFETSVLYLPGYKK
jgi:hypothetical protein